MPRRPPVSIVIPCRDRAALLATCLDRLGPAVGPDDEVVVVDSASRTDEVARVAGEHGVRLVRCALPGASRARNAGWQAASYDDVVFIDDDVAVTDGWLDRLVAPLRDGAGFVTGRAEAPADAAVNGRPASVTLVSPPEVIRNGDRGLYGASNNLALSRSVLRAVGGFDDRIGPGTWFAAGEDLDLLDRVLALPAEGRYVADAVVVHEQWRTPAQHRRLQWAYGKGNGARLAALARRDPATAWRLRGELLRLRGLVTVLRRLLPGTAGTTARPAPGGERLEDVSGWSGPLLWRVGSLAAFAVGVVRLAPRH